MVRSPGRRGEAGEEEAYAERIERLAGDLPVVFFVKNSSLFVGELLEVTEVADEDEHVEADGSDDRPPQGTQSPSH